MPHFVFDARTATPHFPGIGRYARSLARAMAPLLEAGERLTILHDPAHAFPLPATPAVQLAPVDTSPFSAAQQWILPRLLGRLRADLYHSAYFLMPYAPRPSGIPALLTVYDLIPLLFPQHSTLRARGLARWANRLALRTVTRVLAISEATRRDYLAHFRLAPEKIQVTPLAADPAFVRQPAATVDAMRARYGLPERYALYLGSNKPHKNLERLVEAWARLRPRSAYPPAGPRIPLVVAGAWDDRYPEARRRAAALSMEDEVRWLGPAPEAELPALYSGACLFVFPSLYEGFGLPALEAMACGTPVVCSNSSSLPEVTGDAGLLVDPLDVQAMADGMRQVLEDETLRQVMAEKGLCLARRFSWQETARRTLEAYRDLVVSDAHSAHL
jgi:glycosyltransferase involved in cell wall biosynthesis